MTFTSLEFGLLLLATLALFYFLPQRGRLVLLFVASYVFYCFWNPIYGVLIFASTVLDYAMALVIGQSSRRRTRVLALWASVVGNLGMLAYFKYTDFALESLKLLLGPLGESLPGPLHLILPVGISFYTFQTMSYTIDVYRGTKSAERDFLLISVYVSFFPQLVAGPIERAQDLIPQLATRQPFLLANLEAGGRLILWGLLKKLVFADRLTAIAYPIYVDPVRFSPGETVFGVVAMFVVLYLDFSAYSEIAIGTARLFGVQLSRNFAFPHTSTDIAEYWRRWHITMSSWVRDYLYMPLGGFRPRNTLAHIRITLVTMTLVGLWHGASFNFVLWGFLQGLCLVVYHAYRLRIRRPRSESALLQSQGWAFLSWGFTTWTRIVLTIVFFAPDLKRAALIVQRMFAPSTVPTLFEPALILGFSVLACYWLWHYVHYKIPLGDWLMRQNAAVRALAYAAGVFVVFFGASEATQPFIYFQF